MGNKNKLPDFLTKEQLVKLFQSMYRPKCSIACFMALMCGLRVREICNLQIADIDLQKRIIKIRDSKGRRKATGYGKDRFVPIPQIAISPVKKWLDIVQGGKWLIPSAKSPDLPLRTKTLHEWFAEARRLSGLDIIDYSYKERGTDKLKSVFKYRFHHLRHFYAQRVYDKSRDLYAVSTLLGHNQIDTTKIYAKCSDKQMKETIDFCFEDSIRTKIFEKDPIKALNYAIPEIAKRDRSPFEILDERLAKGEISEGEYKEKIRLLKIRKEIVN